MGEKPEKENGEKPEAEKSSYETFDEFLATLDDGVKELYEAHTSGLKTALDRERANTRSLADQLKSLQPKAEKGSELEKELSETLTRLEQAERKTVFLEEAVKPEIGCVNPKVAYALATSEEYFDDKGQPDWKQLKETAPELFRTTPVTNAGTRKKPASTDINAEIRRKAGVDT